MTYILLHTSRRVVYRTHASILDAKPACHKRPSIYNVFCLFSRRRIPFCAAWCSGVRANRSSLYVYYSTCKASAWAKILTFGVADVGAVFRYPELEGVRDNERHQAAELRCRMLGAALRKGSADRKLRLYRAPITIKEFEAGCHSALWANMVWSRRGALNAARVWSGDWRRWG